MMSPKFYSTNILKKLKLITVIGTRPEIIRLAEIIKLADECFDHVLVHTGQNYDYKLNEIFFKFSYRVLYRFYFFY